MKNSRKIARVAGIGTVATLAVFGLTACDETIAPPTSMCGYVVGNGQDDNSRDISHVSYPGERGTYEGDDGSARYFPCGPRNYIVGPTSTDADGTVLLNVRTKQGTQAQVSASVYWMPNQHKDVIEQFITFCEKYDCASGDAGTVGNNFSTDGWNGMLKENMRPVLERIAQASFVDIDDAVWTNDDPALRETAATRMSALFKPEMQKVSGYANDLFCGSGSTGSGETFDCQDVRIVVDNVDAANANLQNQTDEATAQSRETALRAASMEERIKQTDALYGPLAAQVRACQDLGDKVTCVIGGNNVQVVPR